MKTILVAFAALTLICVAGAADGQTASAKPVAARNPQVARGEYLVKGIAGCGDCHTPVNQKGEPVMEQWLQGSKLSFGPLVPIPGWNGTAPSIVGLEGWDHEKAVILLMKGISPNGQPPRPPMPQYHMNRTDAEAVVAYLKSLK